MLRRSTPNSHLQSRKVERIQTFWSHSWSGEVWPKILMVCIYHNALPSVVSGALASLCTLLIPVRWLQHAEVAGLVGLFAGLVVSALVLVGWPCQDEVFLDKACIRQDDDDLKRNGILSLGFFLRRSREMLVLWDGTYLTRLWCVFEIAARLRIQEEDQTVGKLVVMPTLFSVCSFLAYSGHISSIVPDSMMDLFLGGRDPTFTSILTTSVITSASIFVGVLAVSHPVRSYILQGFMLKRQLEQFSVSNAACFCCTHKHRHPETGDTMPCDRELIEEMVKHWFGSTADFDQYARAEILRCQTFREIVMPYWIIAFTCQPFLWEALGRSMWLFKAGQSSAGGLYLLAQTIQASLFNPLIVLLINRSFTTQLGTDAAGAAYAGLMVLISAFIALVNLPLILMSMSLSRLWPWWGEAARFVIFGALNLLCFRHELTARFKGARLG